jgi:hypothetical protein
MIVYIECALIGLVVGLSLGIRRSVDVDLSFSIKATWNEGSSAFCSCSHQIGIYSAVQSDFDRIQRKFRHSTMVWYAPRVAPQSKDNACDVTHYRAIALIAPSS